MNRAGLSQQINQEQINNLKNDTNALLSFLNNQNDKTIVYVLKKLGRLDNSFSKQPLLSLLQNGNGTIRLLAIKNLAKINDITLLDTFAQIADQDQSTEVRRESVSAIGRLRDKKTVSILIKLLSDMDPKVVIQAIRGLLIFADKPQVRKELSKLTKHPNETIQEIIKKKISGVSSETKDFGKHDESPDHLKNTVVQGDVLEILNHIRDESIHLTFTSPPYYNARDYSIYQSYDEYLRFLENVFREVHRITKEGRFFILNTSPIIIPRISRSHASKRYPIPYDIHPLLVKMGWEFIDDIVWVKPEASVKNRNAGFLQHRKPLGYKPNPVFEMLMVYRKKTHKLIDWNMKQYSPDKIKKSKVTEDYETTNVWHIAPTFDKVHSAVFPIELCDKIIRYYSFTGDLVFDPFAGSGTLGCAAFHLDRYFFLTEKEPKYIDRIRQNLTKANDLFSEKEIPPSFIDIKQFMELEKDNM